MPVKNLCTPISHLSNLKILIIKQSALGDVLHVTGILSGVRTLRPNAHIIVLCSKACAPVLRNHPAIDELLEFDRNLFKSKPLRALKKFANLIRTIREHHFELAFDLQGRARSAIFLYVARADRKFIKGEFPFLRGFRKRSLHAIDEMVEVMRMADLDMGSDLQMQFYIKKHALAKANAVVSQFASERLIIMSPFSTHVAKDWALTGFENLINAFLQTRQLNDCHIVVTGTHDRMAEIDHMIDRVADRRVHNLAGKIDLDEFAALAQRASLVVTGDSFPMHLSAALATPLLAIFGPTLESQVGPRGTGPTRIVRSDNCDGCTRPRLCKRRCLTELPTEPVYRAALDLLA